MPRAGDLVEGFLRGALGGLASRRQEEEKFQREISLEREKARVKQEFESPFDQLLRLQLLRQMGLPVGEVSPLTSSTPSAPVLPPGMAEHLEEPQTVGVPGPEGGVVVGRTPEGEEISPSILNRTEMLRRVGVRPELFPSESAVAPSAPPAGGFFEGLEVLPRSKYATVRRSLSSREQEVERLSAARTRGAMTGRPVRLRQGQQDAALGYQQSLQQLTQLEKLLSENPSLTTGLTPIGTQRWEYIRGSKVGNFLRQNQPVAASRFFTTYNRLQDAYRRFITGAQAGFPEVAMFLPTALPNPAVDRPEQFRANLDQFRVELLQGVDRMKNVLRSEGLSDDQIEQVFAGLPEEFGGQGTSGRSGGKLMEDAQGNRAIVYTDGTIEELVP